MTARKQKLQKVRITQLRSTIDKKPNQRAVLRALGLRKRHQTVEHMASPTIMGMVEKVRHLVKVEFVD
ncbi:MAG: 50S ribosomal protein L30 [Calditrichaeota bacterium]|jgi:large subunit ribosomal protein L30|nr:50S ribosomal protein L30 [Calditrichota bacterium]